MNVDERIDLLAVQFAEKTMKPAAWWRERLTEAVKDGAAWKGARDDETFEEFSKRHGAEVAGRLAECALGEEEER